MRAKERQSWFAKNVGKGGQRPSVDPFNKAKKGSERRPDTPEYFNQGIEEYHRYAANKDLTKEDEDKKQQSSESQSKNSRESAKARQQAIAKRTQSIIGRAVASVVGAVVIVTGYNEIQAHEAAKAAPVVTSVEWVWGEDYASATAGLLDEKGAIIKQMPATVTSEEVAATCTAAGTLTYTATYTGDDGKQYTDVKTVTLAAIGHEYEQIGEKVDGDTITTTFECTHCHEQTTVTISITEEDGD